MSNHKSIDPEKLGLSTEVFHKIIDILMIKLSQKTYYKIFVFGSRSKGTYRKYSDIDLWVESTPTLTKNEISDLDEQFIDSDVPVKVDLVTPETCLPEYKKQILSELALINIQKNIK